MHTKHKLSAFLLLLLLLSLGLSNWAFAQDGTLPIDDTTANKIYLPLISSGSTGVNSQVTDSGSLQWKTHDSSSIGLSLAYPTDWNVSVPETSNFSVVPAGLPKEYTHTLNQNYVQTLGQGITLYPTNEGQRSSRTIEINLESYTLSPGGSLAVWVERLTTLHALENPLFVTMKQLATKEAPAGVEQILRTVVETKANYIETVWLSKGEFVYSIRSYVADVELTELVDEIVAQLKFADAEQYQHLRNSQSFAGDETFLEVQIEHLKPVAEPACDIRCQDQKAMEGAATSTDVITAPSEDAADANVQASNIAAVTVSANRKALPANWLTPAYPPSGVTSYPVTCGSTFHTGSAEFAVDAGTPLGTPIYAAFDGYVERSDLDSTGYGNLVLLRTSINIAAEARTYYHAYAHLNARNVTAGSTVSRGALVGWSGNTTGNGTSVGYHLHFHVRDASYNPVDATPVLGFTPNLSYPGTPNGVSVNCGKIEKYDVAPVIIEPVAFTERYQPRNNHNWFCLNTISGATNECYLEATPNNGMNLDPLTPSQSPELRYSNVYLIPPQNPST